MQIGTTHLRKNAKCGPRAHTIDFPQHLKGGAIFGTQKPKEGDGIFANRRGDVKQYFLSFAQRFGHIHRYLYQVANPIYVNNRVIGPTVGHCTRSKAIIDETSGPRAIAGKGCASDG